MSFFKSKRDAGPNRDVAMAVLAPALTVMTIDGEIDPTETEELAHMVRFSPIFAGLPQRETVGMAAEVMRHIATEGPDKVNAHAAALLGPRLSETAYSFAVRVAYADGRMRTSEVTAIHAIEKRLGIDHETAVKIADVVAIMYRDF